VAVAVEDGMQALAQLGQGAECRAQLHQIAGPGGAQCDAGQNALEIADGAEHRRDLFVAGGLHEGGHGLVANAQDLVIPQRAMQPAAQ
jgi:hypothetical protein